MTSFFHKRETHEWIYKLSNVNNVTIYAGLGATIDRTGLSWTGLMDQLLMRFVPDVSTRQAILAKYDAVQVATVIDGYYNEALPRAQNTPERRLEELRGDLSRILYSDRQVMGGKFGASIAEYALQLANSGHSVTIVTPNYDEYLYTDLIDVYNSAVADDPTFPVEVSRHVLDGSARDFEIASTPGVVRVIYLHGYVARPGGKHEGIPVLSEGDYGNTQDHTRAILKTFFANRDIVVVGSSMTDAPLVNALIETNEASRSLQSLRVAILPATPEVRTSASGAMSVTAWRDQRLNHMGITPIYPDFYIQAGQLLHEAQTYVKLGDSSDVLAFHSPERYGSRVVTWWNSWVDGNITVASRQGEHHNLLRQRLLEIRDVCAIPLAENLKLEVWTRWLPTEDPQLGLWASSTGTWVDPYTTRSDRIQINSQYAAVRIFCRGAPSFEADDQPDARWHSYFGTPVWFESGGRRFPAGVIVLSSMIIDGAISPANLRSLDSALIMMVNLGEDIFNSGA